MDGVISVRDMFFLHRYHPYVHSLRLPPNTPLWLDVQLKNTSIDVAAHVEINIRRPLYLGMSLRHRGPSPRNGRRGLFLGFAFEVWHCFWKMSEILCFQTDLLFQFGQLDVPASTFAQPKYYSLVAVDFGPFLQSDNFNLVTLLQFPILSIVSPS